MTRNWIKIISNLRALIMCFAVMIYGLPVMAHAAPDMTMVSSQMMASDSSVEHCDDDMADHSSADNSCCDTGDCDYSCMSLSMAIANLPSSSLEKHKQSHEDRFINHLIGVDLKRLSPPPQA